MVNSESLSRLPWWRRWFGNQAEGAALRYLEEQGFRILERNHRTRDGELDLVALDGPTIVFIEVRSTAANDTERPAISVDARKQARLSNLAVGYLQQHGLLERPARFDVLAVSCPPNTNHHVIRHFRNAFESNGRFQMFQ